MARSPTSRRYKSLRYLATAAILTVAAAAWLGPSACDRLATRKPVSHTTGQRPATTTTTGPTPASNAPNAELIRLERAIYTDSNPGAVFRRVACEMERLRIKYGDQKADSLILDAERVSAYPPPTREARARAEHALAEAMPDPGCDTTGTDGWYIAVPGDTAVPLPGGPNAPIHPTP